MHTLARKKYIKINDYESFSVINCYCLRLKACLLIVLNVVCDRCVITYFYTYGMKVTRDK